MAQKSSWKYVKSRGLYQIPVDGLKVEFTDHGNLARLVGYPKNYTAKTDSKDSNLPREGGVACYLNLPSSVSIYGRMVVVNSVLKHAPTLTTATGLPNGAKADLEKLLKIVDDRIHSRR